MTDEQPPLDIEAIRAHVAAAPAAPWFIRGTWRGGFFVESASGRETIGQLYTEPAAAFTARAREDIPALLAEVERLRAMLREMIDSTELAHPENAPLYQRAHALLGKE